MSFDPWTRSVPRLNTVPNFLLVRSASGGPTRAYLWAEIQSCRCCPSLSSSSLHVYAGVVWCRGPTQLTSPTPPTSSLALSRTLPPAPHRTTATGGASPRAQEQQEPSPGPTRAGAAKGHRLSNVWQVHHRWPCCLLRHRIWRRRPSGTEEGFRRHDTKDCVGQGVVGGDGQGVPGLASHRGASGGHEPHQPPELHRQGPQALIRR